MTDMRIQSTHGRIVTIGVLDVASVKRIRGPFAALVPAFRDWLAPRSPIMYPLSNIVVDIYDWGSR